MDGRTRYRLVVEQTLLELDPSDPLAIVTQLQSRVGECVTQAAQCRLVLSESQSAVAQSFRNYLSRQNDPSRWAAIALHQDVEAMLGSRIGSLNDEECRKAVQRWQVSRLRQHFDHNTPWCVIADWHEENGEPHKSHFCRQMARAAGE